MQIISTKTIDENLELDYLLTTTEILCCGQRFKFEHMIFITCITLPYEIKRAESDSASLDFIDSGFFLEIRIKQKNIEVSTGETTEEQKLSEFFAEMQKLFEFCKELVINPNYQFTKKSTKNDFDKSYQDFLVLRDSV